jgi:hypothetical protein
MHWLVVTGINNLILVFEYTEKKCLENSLGKFVRLPTGAELVQYSDPRYPPA